MNPSAIFILLPLDASIDKIVASIFRMGYGIAPFGNTPFISDQNCPTALLGLRVSPNKVMDVIEIRTTVAQCLTDNNIPFFSIVVVLGAGTVDFAWGASNLTSKETIQSVKKKAKASYLKLVKSNDDLLQDEDITEELSQEIPQIEELSKEEPPQEPTQ